MEDPIYLPKISFEIIKNDFFFPIIKVENYFIVYRLNFANKSYVFCGKSLDKDEAYTMQGIVKVEQNAYITQQSREDIMSCLSSLFQNEDLRQN